MPLEKLYHCRKGSVNWEEVEVVSLFPGVKEGIAEELAIMLEPEMKKLYPLMSLEQAVVFTQ